MSSLLWCFRAGKLILWERRLPASAPPLIAFREVLRAERVGLGWSGTAGHRPSSLLSGDTPSWPVTGREGKGWRPLLILGAPHPCLALFPG